MYNHDYLFVNLNYVIPAPTKELADLQSQARGRGNRLIPRRGDNYKAVSIATNSLVSITATKMLLTPTRRVGVNIGQKITIATNSSSD